MNRVRRWRSRADNAWLAAWTFAVGLATVSVNAPRDALAQECRRMCLVGEVRDANGCCGPAATAPPTVRCPAGTSWNESQRACVGRRVCPSGSHPEGSRCVADAVACPPGTDRRDGQCVLQISCPTGSRLEGSRCVSDVTCPAGTTLTNGACVSQDVTCPSGTTRRPEGGCVATPTCPAGTQFVEGRGCVAPLVCPPLTHVDGDHCAPDHVCVEGEQWIDGACRSVCASITHSRWDGERRSCVCNEGFRAEAGQCTAVSARCPEGSHTEGSQCVADVVCPDGYRYQAGRGCIDPLAEARAAAERIAGQREDAARREQLRREEEERRVTRWGRGPGVQLSAGGGFQFVYMPNAYAAGPPTSPTAVEARSTAQAAWLNGVVTGTASVIVNDFSLSVAYTWGPGSTWQTPSPSGFGVADSRPCPNPSQATSSARRMDGGWCVQTVPMHVLMLDVGQQGVGPRHAWRIGLGAGWEFGSGALASQLSYRSTIKLVAGLFLAVDVRALFFVRLLENNVTQMNSVISREVLQTPAGFDRDVELPGLARVQAGTPPVGVGGALTLSLGYSIH